MTPVNQCDLHCPVKTMLGIKYRLEQQAPDPVARLIGMVHRGIDGVSSMTRAWIACPHRDLPEGQWHASQQCINDAQAMADESSATRTQLTEHETRSLEGVRFRDDPPALGQ